MVDGINLDDIKEFAKAFKIRRLSLGLTQTQVGQALSITEGPAYSQSAICRSVFEFEIFLGSKIRTDTKKNSNNSCNSNVLEAYLSQHNSCPLVHWVLGNFLQI